MVLNHNMSAFDKKLTYILGENNVVLQAHCNNCGTSTHRYKAGKGCNISLSLANCIARKVHTNSVLLMLFI
jgi:hypothetical protein